jgi:hypothetical protein
MKVFTFRKRRFFKFKAVSKFAVSMGVGALVWKARAGGCAYLS